jgi:predicted dehydrogenase
MDAVGLGVIGVGYWGPNLVRNALAHPEVELRWVCDLDLERADRLASGLTGVHSTTDLDLVLGDPAVDGVAIATPAATHTTIAKAALAAGKHILVEKPLARSVEDGLEIVRTAEELGLAVMCDHTFCYTGAVGAIRNLVQGGSLGAVQYFDSVRINLGLVQSDTDVFWDLAPHDLSILDHILPPDVVPVAVSAHGSDPLGIGQACVGYVSLALSNGALAHAHLNWLSPTKVRTTIVGGSEKMVVWNDLDPAQKLSIYDTGVELATLGQEELNRALVSYRTGDMIAPVVDTTEALYRVIGEFADSVRTGRSPMTDGWSGVRVLEQLAAIEESQKKNGTPVALSRAEASSV